MKKEIISHSGLSLDISEVKAIQQVDIFKGNRMVVEFKTRYEYVFNPNTGKYVKQKINDTTEFVFDNYNTASVIISEWCEIWQKYLDRYQ